MIRVIWTQNKKPHTLSFGKKWNLLIIAFPSIYLVEKDFNAIQQLRIKSRNRSEISEIC